MSDKLSEVMGRLAMAGSFAVTPALKDLPAKDVSSSIINPPPIVESAPQVVSAADKTCFTPFSEPAPFAENYKGSIVGACWAVGMFPEGTVSIWKTGGSTLVTLYDRKTNKVVMLAPNEYHIDADKNITINGPSNLSMSGHLDYVDPEMMHFNSTDSNEKDKKPSIFQKLKNLFVKTEGKGSLQIDDMVYTWQPLDPNGRNFKIVIEFNDAPPRVIYATATEDNLLPIQAPFMYLDYRNQQMVLGEIESSLAVPYSSAQSQEKVRAASQEKESNENRLAIPWLPESVQVWAPIIMYEAEKRGIDPMIVALIMTIESAGRPDAGSSVGAQGLMQIMPGTRELIAKNLLHEPTPTDDEIYDPATNIEYGVALLADNLTRLGATNDPDYLESVVRAAAAYNGGDSQAYAYSDGTEMFEESKTYAYWISGMWQERHDSQSPRFDEWVSVQTKGGQPSLVDLASPSLAQAQTYVANWQKNH